MHAWAIPELYANRGAKVVKPRARLGEASERTALGLLGDLVGHEARELHAPDGARDGARRVGRLARGGGGRAARPRAPRALLVRARAGRRRCRRRDRIAHLLLALREDEEGFATVANHAFAGARWRVRRRLPQAHRPALDAAARLRGGTRSPLGDGS